MLFELFLSRLVHNVSALESIRDLLVTQMYDSASAISKSGNQAEDRIEDEEEFAAMVNMRTSYRRKRSKYLTTQVSRV